MVSENQQNTQRVDVRRLDRVVVDEARGNRRSDHPADESDADEDDSCGVYERRRTGAVSLLKPIAQGHEEPEEEQGRGQANERAEVQPILIAQSV